jgi:hypothetical protein
MCIIAPDSMRTTQRPNRPERTTGAVSPWNAHLARELSPCPVSFESSSALAGWEAAFRFYPRGGFSSGRRLAYGVPEAEIAGVVGIDPKASD